jgi:hypothetical protein
MSNLLDKASILLTPTAYDNGRMLSVKPNENLYGSELVTNGDFATDSNWTKGIGWSISNSIASCDGTQTSNSTLTQQNGILGVSLDLVVGRTYKMEFNIVVSSGFITNIEVGGNYKYPALSSSGTYTFYFTPTSTNDRITFTANSSFQGSIDNVSVVEDLSGDFTFSRSSAATRVNAQGLVENVQILSPELVSNGDFSQIGTEEVLNGNFSQEGSELIVNGDFSNGGADWNSQLGWTFSNGLANFENLGSSNRNLWQSPLVAGKSYKLTFEIISISSGYIRNVNSSITDDVQFSTVGVHTQYFIAATPNLYLKASNDAVLSIDNVSVKEVGQNWDLSIGDTAIGENIVIFPTSTNSFLIQNNVASLSVKTYKLQYEVVSTNGSNFRLAGGGSAFGTVNLDSSTTGVKIFYLQSNGTQHSLQFNNNAFIGSITNISVKEVGQDWTFGTGWSIDQANSKAVHDSSAGATAMECTSLSVVVGKRYELKYTANNLSAGYIRAELGGLSPQFNFSSGTYTYNFVATTNANLYVTASADVEVTNISVKEITDDTDLPRINYSGFSYQDTLGSEQVVNGTFDTDITGWVAYSSTLVSWESGGYALLNSNNNYWCKIQQSNVFEIGKTYKVILTAKSDRTDLSFHNSPIVGNFSQADTFETFEQYYTATSTIFLFGYANAGNATITIDNISVKEVTGQEVVPDSGCGSYLLEGQSTNLITYSSDFSQWNNYITTPTLNSATSPSGDVNSAKLTSTGVFGSLNLTISKSSSALNYTQSVFIKGVNYSIVNLISYGSSSANRAQVSFDLSDGSVSSAASVSGAYSNPSESIEDYGNGWYRISLSFTSDTSVEVRPYIQFPIQMTNDDYVLLWGAQLEQSYATSYIPTNGATSTRLQDIATNSGNSSLINSTEGVLYFESEVTPFDSGIKGVEISDGSTSNFISLYFLGGASSTSLNARLSSGGTNVFQQQIKANMNYNQNYKIAFKWEQDNFKIYVDGVLEYLIT